MKVLLDENNYIIGYAVVGDIVDSLDVDFEEKDFNMLPCFLYKYDGKEIILDEEKKKRYDEYLTLVLDLESIKEQIREIEKWMMEYEEEYAKYERCIRLGLSYDKDIDKLNEEAKEKIQMQKRLNSKIETLNIEISNSDF